MKSVCAWYSSEVSNEFQNSWLCPQIVCLRSSYREIFSCWCLILDLTPPPTTLPVPSLCTYMQLICVHYHSLSTTLLVP